MEPITVHASRCYEVNIGAGLLTTAGKAISAVCSGKTAVIVSDDTVYALYGAALEAQLTKAGIQTDRFVFLHGEQSKNLSTYGALLNFLCEKRVSRGDFLVALGGGVVGDLAGFAAATYQRGISFVQIPTTLLAAVDSSVGGKTGIDLDGGKNQVGAFYQPSLVLCDTDTFATLPEAEYRNGCAEIIKYAMLGSKDLFAQLGKLPVNKNYAAVIRACVEMKRDFVERDERDLGCRMLLNFGHTVGHAVETCSDYQIPHGQGVAIGMAVMTKAACSLGLCEKDTEPALVSLLQAYKLPTETDVPLQALAAVMATDKKRSGNTLQLVVPTQIGSCELHTVEKEAIPTWLQAGGVK